MRVKQPPTFDFQIVTYIFNSKNNATIFLNNFDIEIFNFRLLVDELFYFSICNFFDRESSGALFKLRAPPHKFLSTTLLVKKKKCTNLSKY